MTKKLAQVDLRFAHLVRDQFFATQKVVSYRSIQAAYDGRSIYVQQRMRSEYLNPHPRRAEMQTV